jgi:hypothetical protein
MRYLRRKALLNRLKPLGLFAEGGAGGGGTNLEDYALDT